MKLKSVTLGAVALLAGLTLTACGSKSKDESSSSSKDSLSIWTAFPGLPDNASSWKDVPFYTGLEKATGQKIDWEFPSEGTDPAQAFNLMLSEDKLPDMIWYYVMNDADSYIDDGVIQDLSKILPEKAPNYWKFLQDHPDLDRAMKTDSGKYYGFGFFREDPIQTTYLGPMIRQDWLKEQNLSAPTNADEWENALKVLKDKYNAQLSFLPEHRMVPGFAGAFGAYGSFAASYYLDDSNKVQLAQVQPEWQDYMDWLNKLYKEGLIDPDVLTMTEDKDLTTKIDNNKVSATITAASQMTTYNADAKSNKSNAQWVGVPYPNQADGSKTAYIFSEDMLQNHVATLSTACKGKDIDKALKWLDFASTKEGYDYWNFGTEGETWNMKGDVPTYTEKYLEEKRNGSAKMMTGNDGGGQGLQSMDATRQRFDEPTVTAMTDWYDNNQEARGRIIPAGVTLTSAESKEAATIENNIGTYVLENSLKFMTGEKKASEYDSFIKGINKYGLDKLLKIKQDAYDRYMKR